MNIITRILSLFITALCSTATCYAAPPVSEQIAHDFISVAGYVVQANDNDYLIDLGIGQGTIVGDLFNVVVPGNPITHPITGKVIGTDNRSKGLLRLTRLNSGYSHSSPVGSVAGITRGDIIRRYQGLSAVAWDYTDRGEQLVRELQTALPDLQWENYTMAQQHRPATPARRDTYKPTLYFILTSQGVDVRAPDFELIHRYSIAVVAPIARTSAAQTSPATRVTPVIQSASGTTLTVGEPMWDSPSLKGTPVGIEAGDFDGDGQTEVAIAFSDRIEIGRLNHDGYAPLETIRLAGGSHAYALDGADLDANARPELYVSAMNSNGNPAGVSIEFKDEHYQVTRNDIPWHLRRVTLPGEGSVLLAQEFSGSGREFTGHIFHVQYKGGRLVAGEALSLPGRINLYGFAPFNSQGRNLFACLDEDGYLSIISSTGEQLASSVDKVGGTESYFTMNDEVASGGEARQVYLSSRVEADDQGNILVSANSGLSFLAQFKIYVKSELKRLHWNGKELVETWHTSPDKSYLADFKLIPGKPGETAKLLTVVAFPSMKPLTPRSATLHMYELGSP